MDVSTQVSGNGDATRMGRSGGRCGVVDGVFQGTRGLRGNRELGGHISGSVGRLLPAHGSGSGSSGLPQVQPSLRSPLSLSSASSGVASQNCCPSQDLSNATVVEKLSPSSDSSPSSRLGDGLTLGQSTLVEGDMATEPDGVARELCDSEGQGVGLAGTAASETLSITQQEGDLEETTVRGERRSSYRELAMEHHISGGNDGLYSPRRATHVSHGEGHSRLDGARGNAKAREGSGIVSRQPPTGNVESLTRTMNRDDATEAGAGARTNAVSPRAPTAGLCSQRDRQRTSSPSTTGQPLLRRAESARNDGNDVARAPRAAVTVATEATENSSAGQNAHYQDASSKAAAHPAGPGGGSDPDVGRDPPTLAAYSKSIWANLDGLDSDDGSEPNSNVNLNPRPEKAHGTLCSDNAVATSTSFDHGVTRLAASPFTSHVLRPGGRTGGGLVAKSAETPWTTSGQDGAAGIEDSGSSNPKRGATAQQGMKETGDSSDKLGCQERLLSNQATIENGDSMNSQETVASRSLSAERLDTFVSTGGMEPGGRLSMCSNISTSAGVSFGPTLSLFSLAGGMSGGGVDRASGRIAMDDDILDAALDDSD